ncbi:MAG: YhcH/YjgK/YiaL family protein, partial [Candidatus Heimdallarchaeota archaeon]|nr:YhcH/YjgK/YiaL family protein [Candidatus Heimdallarchaeota archaeon]
MICASIPDFKNYIIEHSLFSLVLEFLDKGIDDLGIGRYDLGEGVFAMVSEYQTKDFDEGFIEAHRKYIDIQIILRGAEKIGVADIKTCIPVEYDEEKDFLK